MNLEEIKKIAAARYQGKWWIGHQSELHDNAADIDSEEGAVADNVYGDNNRAFFFMCHEKIDKLIAVVEAAIPFGEYGYSSSRAERRLFEAISELEK